MLLAALLPRRAADVLPKPCGMSLIASVFGHEKPPPLGTMRGFKTSHWIIVDSYLVLLFQLELVSYSALK
jgi:hypothetical protein